MLSLIRLPVLTLIRNWAINVRRIIWRPNRISDRQKNENSRSRTSAWQSASLASTPNTPQKSCCSNPNPNKRSPNVCPPPNCPTVQSRAPFPVITPRVPPSIQRSQFAPPLVHWNQRQGRRGLGGLGGWGRGKLKLYRGVLRGSRAGSWEGLGGCLPARLRSRIKFRWSTAIITLLRNYLSKSP